MWIQRYHVNNATALSTRIQKSSAFSVDAHKPTHAYTHQYSKGDDLEYTLHGEEGGKHYVQVA